MSYTPKRIKKVVIANRGEIAVRVVQAAHELNMKAVALYTDADEGNLVSQLADEKIHIGHSMATKSYLNPDKVIEAAKACGADAIHPGYGFLSENADFAQKVEEAGLIFVGPSADIIRQMGDKAEAILKAKQAGVPTIPGSEVLKNADEAVLEAEKIGYPVVIKAIAGGGGKGIRVVKNEEELRVQYEIASGEAKVAFGNGGVYVEAYLGAARHVEVQVLGDGKNCIHLYDRECSLQRRRQKVVEEAPSIALSDEMREKLCTSALNLAKLVNYKGAGTLEFLYDEARKGFFFLEMNTRIQVEHAITEMITGIDLVREMLRIADGEPLRLKQEDISIRGHSIEIRINAEDPNNNFFPSPGQVSKVFWPSGSGLRVDTMLFDGRVVPPFYDSLVAKLIVYDEDRDFAIKRMNRILKQVRVEGIKTTLPLFSELFKDKDVASGNYNINFLEAWMQKNKE